MSVTDEQLVILLLRDLKAARFKAGELYARGVDVAAVLNPVREALIAARALEAKEPAP